MIFATVGTQLPFDRLIDALDAIAPELDEPIVAQTGVTAGTWPNLTVHAALPPAEFERRFADARVVVAHAGVGTILSAKRLGKPLIIVPRRHGFGEHRNDHQLATAKHVEGLRGVHVAWEVNEIAPLLRAPALEPASEAPSPARDALVARLRGFLAETR